MGKVDCFAIQGLDIWFNSLDHLPWHIHVGRAGEWEIRVFFMECTEDYMAMSVKFPPNGKGPGPADKKAILENVLGHRVSLLEEWERKVAK